ncbi:MAG: amidohydrolase family protein [Gammaproteobacteria bacterium]|nr:amidohydrolase family protein [Gammaproteobacteria bacterium]
MKNKLVQALVYAAASLMIGYAGVVLAAETVAVEEQRSRYLLVHAGSLLAVPGKPPLNQVTIVVRDGLIDEIRDGFSSVSEFEVRSGGDVIELLDLSDRFVLPGLMDMHVHLSFEFGADGQSSHGVADEYAMRHRSAKDDAYSFVAAISNAGKTLNAGYTTVRNVGSEGWHLVALRDAINDGNLTGPRIFTAGHTIRIGADEGEGACSDVASCRRATRAQIDMGADVIKVYATCSGSKPCGYQSAPSVFLEDELRAIVETAATRDIKVAAHAHGTKGINLAASVGVASIEHGSYNNKESHRIMKRNGVFLVPTLSVQDNINEDIKGAKGKMLDIMQAFLDNHGPRMLAAHRAGVRIAAGSDAGVTKHGNNARELEFYVDNGLSPEEAIIAATVNAAELLGISETLGTIEPGKIADMIAVTGNPLDNISLLKNVEAVVKDGAVVVAPE